MRTARALILIVPTVLIACAQAVSQDFVDDEGDGANSHSAGGVGVTTGGKTSSTGGKTGSMSTGGKGGTGTQAFGGTATNGGDTGDAEGGEDTGGTGGGTTAGNGGQASAGSGGKASGGSAGTGGAGGSGGTGQVGKGDCDMTPVFVAGVAPNPGTKYALGALVVSVCTTGTPCTQAQPPLQTGKQYEFKCLDQYNCGTQDPGTTNWADPPWEATKACE